LGKRYSGEKRLRFYGLWGPKQNLNSNITNLNKNSLLDMLDWGNNLTANMPYLKVFIKPESGLLLNVDLTFESLFITL